MKTDIVGMPIQHIDENGNVRAGTILGFDDQGAANLFVHGIGSVQFSVQHKSTAKNDVPRWQHLEEATPVEPPAPAPAA